jgi:predicted ribosomally synthesized peptide with SipW-like signal peptide
MRTPREGAQGMSRKRIKQYLLLLTAVGVVAVAASGVGTFASFTAEVTNNGNTFETGSLTLGDAVESATACWSSGGGAGTNNTNNCGAVFSAIAWQPGDSSTTKKLTLSNSGSLTPAALTFWAPKVDTTGTQDTSGLVCNYEHYQPSGDTNAFVGNGNPCTALKIQIQEYTDSGFGTATGDCAYPAAATPCGSTYATLDTLPTSASPATISGGLASGTSRYFKINVAYPTSGASDNEYQAEKTHFDLTWHIQ